MTTATVAPTEQAERTIVLPEAAPGGTTHHSLAVTTWAPLAARDAVVGWWAAMWSRLWSLARPRWPLLLVLSLLSVTSYRLMMTNTAFLDEAVYLSAGHVIWHGWLHGGPNLDYPTYFSGAPVIYPMIAAAANALGGLMLARLLSLAFVLVTVCLLYATTNLLYDRRAASWAAAVFASVEGTQFLAAFATYDAMSLMLIALTVWIVVRFALSGRAYPHAGLLVGAPVLGFANATKYASGLFDPVVIGMVAIVVASRYGRRIGLRTAALFATLLASELCAALAIAGPEYRHGLVHTTLHRPFGDVSVGLVLGRSLNWVGIVAALGIVSLLIATLQWRVSKERDLSALLLVGLLAVAAFLVPAQQARIHTSTSLAKHVAFGAWFTAIAVGWLLSRLTGKRLRAWWRWTPVLAGVVAMGVLGRSQAMQQYSGWPDMTRVVASLQPYLALTDKEVLMDDADIASYYIGGSPVRWVNTYYFQYTLSGTSTHITGPAAYRKAIAHNYFGLVALHFTVNQDTDGLVMGAMRENPNYLYVGTISVHSNFGIGTYYVWVNLQPVTPS